MIIEKQAFSYIKEQFPKGSYTIATLATAPAQYKGFKAGAEWVLDKAVKWLKENAQNYYEDAAMHNNCWYDDEQMVEDFQKAMKEC